MINNCNSGYSAQFPSESFHNYDYRAHLLFYQHSKNPIFMYTYSNSNIGFLFMACYTKIY